MTHKAKRFLIPCAMLAVALPAAAGVFNLVPSAGTVSGLPGAATGWNYSINNNTGQYLVVANSYFCQAGQDPLFTTCTQTLGTYSDFIANAATIVGPNATVAGTFNAITHQGAGEYVISNTATVGQQDAGNIVVVYDLFTANPFTDPTAQQIGGDIEVMVPAAVQVANRTAVPALTPGAAAALGLLLLACGAFLLRRNRSIDQEIL